MWLGLCFSGAALAQTALPDDLTQISLEQLANLQVTSVSKKEQKMFKTGAAAFVITREDIRRSGATNIPDVLRMAPGVEVARIDSNAWAISIRGFNDRYSNKVLVLVDGRSIYSQTFTGVLWDQAAVPLEEIERIEVIRGPGGTVWGANAVNGVINIITRNSKDTQGASATVEAGTRDGSGMVQYGGKAGASGTYRAYGRYFNVDSSSFPSGLPAADGWHGSQGGFRADLNLSNNDTLAVHGDLYQTAEGQTLTSVLRNQLPAWPTFNQQFGVGSGSLMGEWGHQFANGTDTSLQVSFDRFHRTDEADTTVQQFNADYQYHFQVGDRQDAIAGVGFRSTGSTYLGYFDAFASPASRTDHLFSAFFQDEFELSRTLSLTFGSKIEHNDYTGFEFEPSAQLAWTPSNNRTFWLSAARAIRQPSVLDANFQIDAAIVPLGGPSFGVLQVFGSTQLQAERLNDFEGGYRQKVRKNLWFDVAAYLSYYRGLRTYALADPYFALSPAPPHLVLPVLGSNFGHARDFGFEFYATWDVNSRWRLNPGYGFLRLNPGTEGGIGDTTLSSLRGYSPKHQAKLRSSFNLTRRLEWDASIYFVSALAAGPVEAYTRADTRLGWKAGEKWELSITGQNLLSPNHLEFLNGYQVHPTDSERAVIGRITWHL